MTEPAAGQLVAMAASRGWWVGWLSEQGLLEIVYTSPLDLVGDAVLHKARELTERLGAKRVVIDSITALNLSIATRDVPRSWPTPWSGSFAP